MIFLYSGTPGSGKSLHQADRIYWRLRTNHPVVANYQINTSLFKKKVPFIYLPNEKICPDELIAISKAYFQNHKFKEGAIACYIDECQLLFNAREWQQNGRAEWLSFFTQHRKYGYDVYLVAQFDRMIDRQIRSLIEYEFVHRKVSNFGKFGKILNILTGGGLFVSVEVWYPLKEVIGHEFFHYKKLYGKLYDSYNTFNSFSFGQKTIENSTNITII